MIILVCKWCRRRWTPDEMKDISPDDLATHFVEEHKIKYVDISGIMENFVFLL